MDFASESEVADPLLRMRLPAVLRVLRRPAREFLRAATDLLLPDVCPACGAHATGLCRPCDQALVRRPGMGCRRCGEPVLGVGEACGSEHRDLQNLVQLVAPWRFVGTGGALVRHFKLDGDAGAGRWIGRAMSNAFRSQVGQAWRKAVVVPVPLHAARRRQRGFDQAAWLAEELGRRLGLRVAVDTMARTRATLPQGDPRVTSRERNVEGAFVVRRGGVAAVAGRQVVLVDDVFTSGATARQCAAVLRAAGARHVLMLTACRS